jgi:hypothetical protein
MQEKFKAISQGNLVDSTQIMIWETAKLLSTIIAKYRLHNKLKNKKVESEL